MFDISYKKTYNKQRRGERGPKQRYAVFRAELNLKHEEDCKLWCENYCNRKGLNLEDYKIEHEQFPWIMTWEYIIILNRFWPYNLNGFVLRNKNAETLEGLRNNIEIAEKIKIEQEKERKLL